MTLCFFEPTLDRIRVKPIYLFLAGVGLTEEPLKRYGRYPCEDTVLYTAKYMTHVDFQWEMAHRMWDEIVREH